jgi:hypothetical protein
MEHPSSGGLSLPRPFSFWQTCQVRRFLVLGTLPTGTAIRFTRYATLRDCELAGERDSCGPQRHTAARMGFPITQLAWIPSRQPSRRYLQGRVLATTTSIRWLSELLAQTPTCCADQPGEARLVLGKSMPFIPLPARSERASLIDWPLHHFGWQFAPRHSFHRTIKFCAPHYPG